MNAVADARPCWVDLSTTDPAGAEAFYRDVLGWDVHRHETPVGVYLIGMVGDREVAGMMAQAPDAAGAPSAWTVYFWVDDLDDVVRRVAAAGGSVLAAPFEIPGGDRVSVVADSTDAVFGLMSGTSQPDLIYSMAAGAVGWFELMTRDTAAAVRFYDELFGWQAETGDADGVEYSVFSVGDAQLGGMIATPDELGEDVPDSWSIYFTVADCSASVERVRDLGGQVLKATTPTPMGPFAVVADPQGAVFQLMEFTEQSE